MTPFYLFFGVLLIYIFQSQINLNKLKGFASIFLILFIFSPFAYAYISITQTDKRTDYPGKVIAQKVQKEWNKNFKTKIGLVTGDEWIAGNLSYHLESRPRWMNPKIQLYFDVKDYPERMKKTFGSIITKHVWREAILQVYGGYGAIHIRGQTESCGDVLSFIINNIKICADGNEE